MLRKIISCHANCTPPIFSQEKSARRSAGCQDSYRQSLLWNPKRIFFVGEIASTISAVSHSQRLSLGGSRALLNICSFSQVVGSGRIGCLDENGYEEAVYFSCSSNRSSTVMHFGQQRCLKLIVGQIQWRRSLRKGVMSPLNF